MEGSEGKNFENRELIIDKLISELAKKEEMDQGAILSDIVVFFEVGNFEYLHQVAEMIGITHEEMIEYASKKAKEQLDNQN